MSRLPLDDAGRAHQRYNGDPFDGQKNMLAQNIKTYLSVVKAGLAQQGVRPDDDVASSLLLEVAAEFLVSERGRHELIRHLQEILADAVADRVAPRIF